MFTLRPNNSATICLMHMQLCNITSYVHVCRAVSNIALACSQHAVPRTPGNSDGWEQRLSCTLENTFEAAAQEVELGLDFHRFSKCSTP